MSVTKVEYASETNALQIISSIFIDDIEEVLQKRYRKDVSLATNKETEADVVLLQQYVFQKLSVTTDGKPLKMKYIGREYDDGIARWRI